MMTEQRVVRSGEEYIKHFDGQAYASILFDNVEGSEHSKFTKFRLDNLHKLFSTGNLKGKLLLEIGSGPCIHTVIPAAKWFDEIVLTDYSPSNREMQEKWLKKSPDAHNWEPFLRYYSKLNGNEDDWKQLECDLRPKIKQVLPCNVHLLNPLDPVKLGMADLIASSACLESASSSIAEYNQAMKNVTSLLKPGGHFILIGILNSTHYPVGKETFKCLSVTKEQVLDSVKAAGLNVLEYYEDDTAWNDDYVAFNGSIIIHAVKE